MSAKRSRKRHPKPDETQVAKFIVESVTGESMAPDAAKPNGAAKRPARKRTKGKKSDRG